MVILKVKCPKCRQEHKKDFVGLITEIDKLCPEHEKEYWRLKREYGIDNIDSFLSIIGRS